MGSRDQVADEDSGSHPDRDPCGGGAPDCSDPSAEAGREEERAEATERMR